MSYPLNETITTEAGEIKVFAWEIIKPTLLTDDGDPVITTAREELRIHCLKNTLLGPGAKVTVDDNAGDWYITGVPKETRGGWWQPGLVTYCATRTR